MFSEEYVKKIDRLRGKLPSRFYVPVGTTEFEGFFTYDRLSYEDAVKHDRQKLPQGLRWGRKWEYGWFFTQITVPKECEGKRICFKADLVESTVYVNGRVVGALDHAHKEIMLSASAKAGETFDIAAEVYAGHGDEMIKDVMHYTALIPELNIKPFPEDVTQKCVSNGTYGIFRDDVFQLYVDIEVLVDLSKCQEETSLRRAKIEKAIRKIADFVDLELPYDEFAENVKQAREILKPLFDCHNGPTVPTMYAISHSHLDLEWLWTVNETTRKCARTIGNQLELINEFDDCKYIQSQAWILETVKNNYPELYERVKQAVKSGNIVVEGGMWVESDANIPAGESIIRQFVFGKKFMKNEFGVDSEILWLPDTFGISGAFPQILKGCGIKYFMSAKLMWLINGGDVFPYSMFNWKGNDGSEVLCNIIRGYANGTYPSQTKVHWGFNSERDNIPYRLYPYGFGDGGGGATRFYYEQLKREHDLEGMPKVIQASPNKFFHDVENECEIDKTYVGELYYALHRGTFTSQAKTKLLNRKCENELRDAELWSAFLRQDTKEKTDPLWKTVLFNQFHDILPGSSIAEVYERAESELSEVAEKAENITKDVLETVSETKDGVITVFNSLSWDRKAYIKLPEGYTSICASDGKAYECETDANGTFAAVDVPSCGYASFVLGKEKANAVSSGTKPILENDLVRAEFNENGELSSVVDKQTGIEFLSGRSNRLRMYEDQTAAHDAWDIDSIYQNNEVKLAEPAKIESIQSGTLASSLVIKREINNSTLVQKVTLRKGSRAIEFDTQIDWKERHKLLKVDFDTNFNTEELISETQYGFVKRPTHRNRKYDADRFEVCQHKWSALAESNRAAAILNNCKYGISADGGRMSLTLLKAPQNPALNADMGIQRFTYCFMPFCGTFYNSNIVNAAFELNCPVKVVPGYADKQSVLSISHPNVVLTAAKISEDGENDIVIRLAEETNNYTKCSVKLGFAVKEAYLTNMLEEDAECVAVTDDTIKLNFRAFEVKTIRLKLKQ